jgi:hypothetical protein
VAGNVSATGGMSSMGRLRLAVFAVWAVIVMGVVFGPAVWYGSRRIPQAQWPLSIVLLQDWGSKVAFFPAWPVLPALASLGWVTVPVTAREQAAVIRGLIGGLLPVVGGAFWVGLVPAVVGRVRSRLMPQGDTGAVKDR